MANEKVDPVGREAVEGLAQDDCFCCINAANIRKALSRYNDILRDRVNAIGANRDRQGLRRRCESPVLGRFVD